MSVRNNWRALSSRLWVADYSLRDFRGDVLGGILTAVVLLPAGITYGTLSGLGPAAGLYGAVAGGVFAGVTCGVRGLMVSPNAFNAIVLAAVVTGSVDSITVAMIIGVGAGLVQIACGVLRLGSFTTYTSSSVLSGVITAVGILIIVVQLLPLLGMTVVGGVVETIAALPAAIAGANVHALLIGVLAFALALFWRGRIGRFVPATVPALIFGSILALLWLRDAPVIGPIPTGWPNLHLPTLSAELLVDLFRPMLTIALLSSTSALSLSRFLDAVTGGRHNPDRLLAGLGISNIAAGLIGALPGAGSGASWLNIKVGGRAPVASIVMALTLLLGLAGLSGALSYIPLAAMSGILLKIGWDLIDWSFLKHIHRISPYHVSVMLITLLLALFVDFLLAIVVGLAVSGFVNARILQSFEIRGLVSVPLLDQHILDGDELPEDADPFSARVGLFQFPMRVSVASAHETIRLAGPDLAGHQIVIFDFSTTEFIDDTAADIINQLINRAVVAQGKPCIVSGLTDDVAKTLHALDVFKDVPDEHIVGSIGEATELVRRL